LEEYFIGIPIVILLQRNHFKSKRQYNLACNVTQYYSILLLLI